MAKHHEIISAKASLEGAKQLYLIVVGIGVTESLTHSQAVPLSLDAWSGYLLLLMGYLFWVFRLSLGIINLLDHVSGKLTAEWTQSITLACLGFLGTALALFGMGTTLQNPGLFSLFMLVLLACHTFSLFVCHKPWSPPRGWGGWMLSKTLAIVLGYPGGWYDPQKDTRHYHPMNDEQVQIKLTHYHWIRVNFWLSLLMLLLLTPAAREQLPIHWQTPHGFQTLWGLLLIGFTWLDFSYNRPYYFGLPSATSTTPEPVDY